MSSKKQRFAQPQVIRTEIRYVVKGGGKGAKPGKKNVVGKLNGKARGNSMDDKMKAKMTAIAPELKVWVGNLTVKTDWKMIRKHFEDVAKPQLVTVMKKGTACVAYKT